MGFSPIRAWPSTSTLWRARPSLCTSSPISWWRASERRVPVTELLNSVLQAHGGIERWKSFDTVRATFSSSGGLLPLKGLDVTPQPTEGVATIHEETLRIDGYRRPDWRMRFTPDRVVIEGKNA